MALLERLLLLGLCHAGVLPGLALAHGLLRDLDRVLLEELVEDIHALLRRCRSQRPFGLDCAGGDLSFLPLYAQRLGGDLPTGDRGSGSRE